MTTMTQELDAIAQDAQELRRKLKAAKARIDAKAQEVLDKYPLL